MSRAGYADDCDDWWQHIKWRGQVTSAIRGRRGQAFLRELLAALDAMPEPRLIANDLQDDQGGVCALGCVGVARGIPLQPLDPNDYATLASTFDIAAPLVREIEFENDEAGAWSEPPERRWRRVRAWVASAIRKD